MEEDYEIENEGIINRPKIMKLSSLSFMNKKDKLDDKKIKNSSSTNMSSIFLDNNSEDNNEQLNNTIIIDRNKFFFKNEDNNSTITKSQINEKIKKVTFSTIEIIRVKNYKRYNKLNTAKKNEDKISSYNNCILI